MPVKTVSIGGSIFNILQEPLREEFFSFAALPGDLADAAGDSMKLHVLEISLLRISNIRWRKSSHFPSQNGPQMIAGLIHVIDTSQLRYCPAFWTAEL